MNLYEKIVNVMESVSYLQKDDNVGTGNSSYKAISEEKVTSAVRDNLIKNKLVILPIKQETKEVFTEYVKEAYGKVEKKQRLMTTVNVTYKIVNAENPDEYIEVVSSGSGADTQDKGVGKAMTYAYKYMCLRTFAIPTGNDPDKIHNNDLEKETSVDVSRTKKIKNMIKKLDDVRKEKILQTYNAKGIEFLKENQLEEINKLMKWGI